MMRSSQSPPSLSNVGTQTALNLCLVLCSILLYMATLGRWSASVSLSYNHSPMEETIRDQQTDARTTTTLHALDRHEIHGTYVYFQFPHHTFQQMATEAHARAPPTVAQLQQPLPTDLVDLFDATLMQAAGGPTTVSVVIGVLSPLSNAKQRQLIRQTWGRWKNHKDNNNQEERVLFVVGWEPNKNSNDNSNKDPTTPLEMSFTWPVELQQEFAQHEDLIVVQSLDPTTLATILAAAVVKYLANARHLLTVLNDTTYVRVPALQQLSDTHLAHIPYWGYCGPHDVNDKHFFAVPSDVQEHGMFPYPTWPKMALGAYMIDWKVARCVTHLSAAVPPLPDPAANMAVLTRDCRVACWSDPRVQVDAATLSPYPVAVTSSHAKNATQNEAQTNMFHDMATLLIRTRVPSEDMALLHQRIQELNNDAVLNETIQPQECPFPYLDMPDKSTGGKRPAA